MMMMMSCMVFFLVPLPESIAFGSHIVNCAKAMIMIINANVKLIRIHFWSSIADLNLFELIEPCCCIEHKRHVDHMITTKTTMTTMAQLGRYQPANNHSRDTFYTKQWIVAHGPQKYQRRSNGTRMAHNNRSWRLSAPFFSSVASSSSSSAAAIF